MCEADAQASQEEADRAEPYREDVPITVDELLELLHVDLFSVGVGFDEISRLAPLQLLSPCLR